jgi:hypothetical protein
MDPVTRQTDYPLHIVLGKVMRVLEDDDVSPANGPQRKDSIVMDPGAPNANLLTSR